MSATKDTKKEEPKKEDASKKEETKAEKKEEKKEAAAPTMEYRMLGGTGLKVSCLGYGYWGTFGTKETDKDYINTAVKSSLPIIRAARNAGINFFDNAEAYGKKYGDAEIIMGKGFKILEKEDPVKYRRTDLVFTTKIYWGGQGLNEKGLSSKHVSEAMNNSLKRLEMDYVDVVFCHRPDPLTPTEEVVRAFTKIIRDGKAFYWGTSEWSAQQITEAYYIAKIEKLIPPVVEQPQYNMFERNRMEKEYLRLFNAPYKMGTTIWSPLASGWLTGKYNEGIPDGSRLKQYSWLAPDFKKMQSERVPKIKAIAKIAKEKYNTTSTILAIAWVLKNANVSVCLLGASKLYQIEENLKAFGIACKLTKDDYDAIEKILDNKPETRSWRTVESLIQTV